MYAYSTEDIILCMAAQSDRHVLVQPVTAIMTISWMTISVSILELRDGPLK